MVKSVDHESNTGSYVLWGIGGIADSRKLYPCLFKYLAPMTTVPRGLLDILKIVKSVDHRFNTGSDVP